MVAIVVTWDGEGLWPLRAWTKAITGKLVLFGRLERLAGQLTHARQGERVVVWRERPYQNGYLADGASKFGDTPDLPQGLAWPEHVGQPLPFYAQIHCADLAASDVDGLLPHEGRLYFFYDVLADDSGSPLVKTPQPDFWCVLYSPDERV